MISIRKYFTTMQGVFIENQDYINAVHIQPIQEPHALIEQVPQEPTEMLTRRGLPMRRSARGVAARVIGILSWEQASENSKSVQDVAEAFENEFRSEAENKKRRVTCQAPDSDSEVELGDTDDDEDRSSIIDSSSEDHDFAQPMQETESESELDDNNGISDYGSHSEFSDSQAEFSETHSEIADSKVDTVDSQFHSVYGTIEDSQSEITASQMDMTQLQSDGAQFMTRDSLSDIAEQPTDISQISFEIPQISFEIPDLVREHSQLADINLLTHVEQVQVDDFFAV